jgi:hypothetical protein
MLGFTTRTRRSVSAHRNRLRLMLERLERRECLTVPVITSFTITATSGTNVHMAGHVQDPNPATVFLTITGVVIAGANADANGDFSCDSTATALGTAHAIATDGGGNTSATVDAVLSVAGPEITSFTASCNLGNIWTFSGHIASGENPQGMTVVLSGLPDLNNVHVTVDANGNFSFTKQLAQGDNGTVTANITDWWGQSDEPASVVVS